jgi:hypothetical protein
VDSGQWNEPQARLLNQVLIPEKLKVIEWDELGDRSSLPDFLEDYRADVVFGQQVNPGQGLLDLLFTGNVRLPVVHASLPLQERMLARFQYA